ncbi:MAG: single-stranded-DNA-specific exonuclease RecJ [Actinobacteria bacterium]|nr:single-stranded-DNA-specific exonuclease RecJ [Actinomycetota bacterium]
MPGRWDVASPDAAAVASLAAETGLSATTAGVLLARGIGTPDAVRRFLEPSLDRDWVSATDIPGMAEAAAAVAEAVRAGKHIVVFGDFDLDGISAAAAATLGLRGMGADVTPVVPHRFREGYGLTPAALERVAAMSPELVITVDCGISNAAEIAELARRGIAAVVTDHHEPGEGVPDGVPVADPKLAPGGPELSGAGVTLALVREAGALLGAPDVWRTLTDLAMLGTIADIVPLVGPNRALVADGLARLRDAPRAGLAALAEVAGVPLEAIDADRVAYSLAPRLNAAGRMADPEIAVRLLVGDDPSEANVLAHALDEHNRIRQAAEGDLFDAAVAVAERTFASGDRVLVVAGEDWHEGVRGIVASRLTARFGVPSLVFCIEDGVAQGSGRSVEGVDLYAALAALAPMLERYGGHEMAVGLALPAESLPALREALASALGTLPAGDFVPTVAVDAEVRLDTLSRELAAELALLGPFGYGNRRPLLAARGVFMNGRKKVGKAAEHLKFTAYDGVASVPAIAFRCADIDSLAATETAVDIAFELDCDEWRGRERIQLLARDFRVRAGDAAAPAAELVEDLFANADEILARGEYSGIAEAESFHTKLAGVTFEGRQEVVARLQPGVPLRLERQPDNAYDANACALFDPFGDQVGFLNRRLAAVLAPVLDAGVEYDVEVTETTGGEEGASLGVNVLVSRRAEDTELDEELRRLACERRAELAALPTSELDLALKQHFIGDRELHPAQAEALTHLAAGRSTLAVMATGRGKSLIFHLHAVRLAVAGGGASVFVYPLRALVADQVFHLEESFAELGCAVTTLTGESSPTARDATFAALADGSLDVVLTTPEFLDHHAARFAEAGTVRFVVVDEAHHVGLARAGHRPAYARLDRALEALGAPVVLAVTATAPAEVADAIATTLGVTETVLDPTVRDNLRIVDGRGGDDKPARLAALAASGQKLIAYVNSREVSVQLARQLRSRVPDLLHRVAFYNGGMSREARHAVERAFRDGEITAVVATSAFGEGVNIPDIRHVVLYHLPFGGVEFNQLCGRGGRDGAPASVHLLFGSKDAKLNRMILEASAPSREDLAALYLVLREATVDSGGEVEITNGELAERVKRRRPQATLSERGASTGVSVFRELGLVASEGHGAYRRLTMLPAPDAKLDLASSVRYAEGMDELEDFESFRERAFEATPDELLHAFNRPILPTQPDDGGRECR